MKKTLEQKLERFIEGIYSKHGQAPYTPQAEFKIIHKISRWVNANYIYTYEGIRHTGNPDAWVASIQDVLDKSVDGYAIGDCDDFAMFGFFIAEDLGVREIRLAIVFQKLGKVWKNNSHMVWVYRGLGKPYMIPSTQAIGKFLITLKYAFFDGWWIAEEFDKHFHYVPDRPKEVENE